MLIFLTSQLEEVGRRDRDSEIMLLICDGGALKSSDDYDRVPFNGEIFEL
jgi:hypothetical protein